LCFRISGNASCRSGANSCRNPEDGLPVMPERLGERVDGRDEARALLGEAGVLPEKVIEHVDDEKRHPEHNCSSRNL